MVASSSKSGQATALTEQAKVAKYGALCESDGLLFSPFVIEAYGGFGLQATALVKRLGELIADKSDLSCSVATARLATSLSMAMMKGVGRALDSRYPQMSLA